MLARHAEALFWCGRYIERAESTARLLDVTYHAQLEAVPWEANRAWRDLLSVLQLDTAFDELEYAHTAITVSSWLVHSANCEGSLLNSIKAARTNAGTVREIVPTELWMTINAAYLAFSARELDEELDNRPHDVYSEVRRSCQAMYGVASSTMPREDGWNFLTLGWMLERAQIMARLLDVRYPQLVQGGAQGGFQHWQVTLRSASASEAFRKSYGAEMNAHNVFDFLLRSSTCPRSMLFALTSAEECIKRADGLGAARSPAARLVGQIRSDVDYLDVDAVMDENMHSFLRRLSGDLRRLGQQIAAQYFQNASVWALHAHPRDRI